MDKSWIFFLFIFVLVSCQRSVDITRQGTQQDGAPKEQVVEENEAQPLYVTVDNLSNNLNINSSNINTIFFNGQCSDPGVPVTFTILNVGQKVTTCSSIKTWYAYLDLSQAISGKHLTTVIHGQGNRVKVINFQLNITIDLTSPSLPNSSDLIFGPMSLGATSSDPFPSLNATFPPEESQGVLSLYSDSSCINLIGKGQVNLNGQVAIIFDLSSSGGSNDGLKKFYMSFKDKNGNINAQGCTDTGFYYFLDTVAPKLNPIHGLTLDSPIAALSNEINPSISGGNFIGEENAIFHLYKESTCSTSIAESTILNDGTLNSPLTPTFNNNGTDDGLIQFYGQIEEASGLLSLCTTLSGISYTLDTIPIQLGLGAWVLSTTPASTPTNDTSPTLDLTGQPLANDSALVNLYAYPDSLPTPNPALSCSGQATFLTSGTLTGGAITLVGGIADDSGNGIWHFVIEVIDPAQNSGGCESLGLSMQLDITPPILVNNSFQFISPSTPFGGYSLDPLPVISGQVNRGNLGTASLYTYNYGDPTGARPNTPAICIDPPLQTINPIVGDNNATVTFNAIDLSASSDQTFGFAIVLTDALGNQTGCLPLSLYYTLDRISPTDPTNVRPTTNQHILRNLTTVFPTNGVNVTPLTWTSGSDLYHDHDEYKFCTDINCSIGCVIPAPQNVNINVPIDQNVFFSSPALVNQTFYHLCVRTKDKATNASNWVSSNKKLMVTTGSLVRGDRESDLIYDLTGDLVSVIYIGNYGEDIIRAGSGDDIIYADGIQYSQIGQSRLMIDPTDSKKIRQKRTQADGIVEFAIDLIGDDPPNRDLTPPILGSSPTLNSLNGRKAFNFDGIDDSLQSGGIVINNTDNHELFIVGDVSQGALLEGGSYPAQGEFLLEILPTTGFFEGNWIDNPSTNTITSVLDYSSFPSIFYQELIGTNFLTAANADNINNIPIAGALPGNPTAINVGGTTPLNGKVGEILAFEGPITSSQRMTIEDYLSFKWDIELSATPHGADRLYGGAGSDIFMWTNAGHSPANRQDIIEDFSIAEFDKVYIYGQSEELIIRRLSDSVFCGGTFSGMGYSEIRCISTTCEGGGPDTAIQIDWDGDATADWSICLNGITASNLTEAHLAISKVKGDKNPGTIYGGHLNDRLVGGDGGDFIDAGDGNDIVYPDHPDLDAFEYGTMELWLDGQNPQIVGTTLADGVPITNLYWKDRSPRNNDMELVNGIEAEFKHNTIKGHSAIDFGVAGASAIYKATNAFDIDQFTIFMIIENSNILGTNNSIIYEYTNDPQDGLGISLTNYDSYDDTVGGNVGGTIGVNKDTINPDYASSTLVSAKRIGPDWLVDYGREILGRHIFDGTHTGHNYYIDGAIAPGLIDDNPHFLDPGTTSFSSLFFFLGGRAPASYLFTGAIGEIIVYPTNLNQYEIESIEGYLAQKWGITIYPNDITTPDHIHLGLGNDRLMITSGTYSTSTVDSRDYVDDFTQGQDKIDLSEIPGTFVFLGEAPPAGNLFTGANKEVFYINETSTECRTGSLSGQCTVVYIDTDADGDGDIIFELDGNIDLIGTDFFL